MNRMPSADPSWPRDSGVEIEPEVLIVGAGAAGLAASIAAARAGGDVCLVEASDLLGGTVTHSLIHTLGGLYDSRGELLNDGLVRELVDRLLDKDNRVCVSLGYPTRGGIMAAIRSARTSRVDRTLD